MVKENITNRVKRCEVCGQAYEAYNYFEDDGKCETCGDWDDYSVSPHAMVIEKDYIQTPE